ncbi:MAG: hypothetical protein QF619_05565 [Candidatus Binatia bacterium]|jgi:hypothetical protein|nr:hypothetical protein [Candidatus Binatia bacterium]
MKLSVKSLAATLAILGGIGFLFVAALNLVWPPYGKELLGVISSVYPGYTAVGNLENVIVGTLYAIVDGAIGGALLAWLYNQFA